MNDIKYIKNNYIAHKVAKLQYDPTIPFLGIYPREYICSQKSLYINVSQQHYSQQPKKWKQPNVH